MMINYFKVVVFEKFATFTGRARRAEYWYFVLANIILSVILTYVDISVGTYNMDSGNGLLSSILSLVLLIPSLAVAVRRMHDVGKSGWFILIPIYNLILAVTEGEKGSNKYGPDPKNPEMSVEDHLLD
jgi:uncharacterized membrane protein YhaH (DUF805 family)